MVSAGLERAHRRWRTGGDHGRLPSAQGRRGVVGPGIWRLPVALSARQTKTRGGLPDSSRPHALVPGRSKAWRNQPFALARLLSGANQGGPCLPGGDAPGVSGSRLLSRRTAGCCAGQNSAQPAPLTNSNRLPRSQTPATRIVGGEASDMLPQMANALQRTQEVSPTPPPLPKRPLHRACAAALNTLRGRVLL